MRKSLAILLVVLGTLCTFACARNSAPVKVDPALVGVWDLDIDATMEGEPQEQIDEMKASGVTMILCFYENGLGTLTQAAGTTSQTDRFAYSAENGRVLVKGEPQDYRVEGDVLTITIDGEALIFTRR